MRDKLHTEPVKIRLSEDDKAYFENIALARGIPPAVLARTLIKQFLVLAKFEASIQTGGNGARGQESLGVKLHGTRSAA